MKTEKQLQDYIIKECKKRNILCHKLESRTSRGWPDLILIYNSVAIFAEVKSPVGTGKLSALQVRTLNDIKSHGGLTVVVESKLDADAVLYAMGRADAKS